MKIKWANVIALLLIVFAIIIWIKAGPQIWEFLSAITKVAPSGDKDDRIFGLMAFGLIGVIIVAVTKILASRQ